MSKDESQKKDVIEELKSGTHHKNNYKACFWATANTPSAPVKTKEEIKKGFLCPANRSHSIKLKELISLKFCLLEKQYSCWFCQKPFIKQKVSVLRACGHVFCSSCAKSHCGVKCTECE